MRFVLPGIELIDALFILRMVWFGDSLVALCFGLFVNKRLKKWFILILFRCEIVKDREMYSEIKSFKIEVI